MSFQLTVVENSPPGTILFEVLVTDADYLYGKKNIFEYTLSGEGSTNFQVREVNFLLAKTDFILIKDRFNRPLEFSAQFF